MKIEEITREIKELEQKASCLRHARESYQKSKMDKLEIEGIRGISWCLGNLTGQSLRLETTRATIDGQTVRNLHYSVRDGEIRLTFSESGRLDVEIPPCAMEKFFSEYRPIAITGIQGYGDDFVQCLEDFYQTINKILPLVKQKLVGRP